MSSFAAHKQRVREAPGVVVRGEGEMWLAYEQEDRVISIQDPRGRAPLGVSMCPDIPAPKMAQMLHPIIRHRLGERGVELMLDALAAF